MPGREIRIGVIGWDYPEWKGLVYPSDAKREDFLRHYAERFPLVESASAYYGMPKTDAVARWAEETPDDFTIALKVPDWILKKKPDDPDTARALGVFLQHLAPLAEVGKLGALVAQFSPYYRADKKAKDLAAFVRALPGGPRWAVELRHASWWRKETYETLRAANVTLVWSALGEGARTPTEVTSDSLYLRLFGDRDLPPPYAQKRRDASDELHHWADRIHDEGAAAKRVDVLVSKYLEGYAPGTAETMEAMLDVSPTTRVTTRSGVRQTTLF